MQLCHIKHVTNCQLLHMTYFVDCFSIDDFKDMLHDESESLIINLKIQVGA